MPARCSWPPVAAAAAPLTDGRSTSVSSSFPAAADSPWRAPRSPDPVRAHVSLPGSKSATNRALILSALSPGSSRLYGGLRSRDTDLMTEGLRSLGVTVDTDGPHWTVTGGQLEARRPAVDVGNAGTVARFLPAVAGLALGSVRIDGDTRMRERPLGPLLTALRALGVSVDDNGRGGLPITVHGTGQVRGGEVTVDASASSQLVSGLLLAAPCYGEGVVVRHAGPPIPSAPHLAMTVAMLRDAGATVQEGADRWHVEPGGLRPRDWSIEPDLSSAAPFLAAAAVTAGEVAITGWPESSTQPGARLPELLTAMGASIERRDGALVVRGPDRLVGVDVDLHDVGELTPVLTAIAALADGPSRFRGIAHLRQHETDRLAALAGELTALGGDLRETADGLEIRPRPLQGGRVSSHDDHRLAMAWAVLGLVVDGVLVDDIATTAKTLPDFPDRWSRMLSDQRTSEDAS